MMFMALSEESLTHFYTPLKHQKNKGFRMFSGCIEKSWWDEVRDEVVKILLKTV